MSSRGQRGRRRLAVHFRSGRPGGVLCGADRAMRARGAEVRITDLADQVSCENCRRTLRRYRQAQARAALAKAPISD